MSGMDCGARNSVIPTLKNEMEANGYGNIKQKGLGSRKSDC